MFNRKKKHAYFLPKLTGKQVFHLFFSFHLRRFDSAVPRKYLKLLFQLVLHSVVYSWEFFSSLLSIVDAVLRFQFIAYNSHTHTHKYCVHKFMISYSRESSAFFKMLLHTCQTLQWTRMKQFSLHLNCIHEQYEKQIPDNEHKKKRHKNNDMKLNSVDFFASAFCVRLFVSAVFVYLFVVIVCYKCLLFVCCFFSHLPLAVPYDCILC